MLSLGDAIVVNFTMKEHEKTIEEVRIVGNIKNKINNFGRATSITPKDIAKLPVNGRNFANLTDLSPLSNGGNIMGQIGTATNFTIDGMTAKNPTSAGPTTYRSGAT